MLKGPMKYFVGFMFIVFIAIMILFYIEIQTAQNIQIQHHDVLKIEDGTYVGESSTILISVKVEVIVKDHEIEDIKILELRHNEGHGAEEVVENIIEGNSTDVDNIATATVSSRLIKAAVADALAKGVRP